MFLCISINDSRKCKSAHDLGKSNREKQNRGRGMAASMFTKLDCETPLLTLIKTLFLQNFLTKE